MDKEGFLQNFTLKSIYSSPLLSFVCEFNQKYPLSRKNKVTLNKDTANESYVNQGLLSSCRTLSGQEELVLLISLSQATA